MKAKVSKTCDCARIIKSCIWNKAKLYQVLNTFQELNRYYDIDNQMEVVVLQCRRCKKIYSRGGKKNEGSINQRQTYRLF